MHVLDIIVLVGYFLTMAGIGVWAMRRVKKQEDYFMGGRGFGKLMQTFAAFGAGTGSADPINTAKTTFMFGMSGMWSVMYWLFVTPIYWFAGVWYRRMRHLTLGDWFVERYESRGLGAAYTVFGIFFYIVYTAMLFEAIGKFAGAITSVSGVEMMGTTIAIENVLIIVIAIIVMVYGILGGITAAYWTDLIQGICIIGLSVMLIPFGLNKLVEVYGNSETEGMMSGFRILHEQLPANSFELFGSSSSDFTLASVVAIVVINLLTIVVLPHFIVTGGGSAKSETSARVGLVTGNLLKRFCTIGWTLTALIAIVLFSGRADVISDSDKVWGVTSAELLPPGLVGLMLACLLAALMSSADCYMIVCSALVVRNIHVAYINPKASDKTCLLIGRCTSAIVIVGAVIFSLMSDSVYDLLKMTWVIPVTFAAPFWIGMFWRRATTKAAWSTVVFVLVLFYILPYLLPAMMPSLRENQSLTAVTNQVTVTEFYETTPSDLRKRFAEIELWNKWENDGDESTVNAGPRPEPFEIGDTGIRVNKTGGQAIYWDEVVVKEGTEKVMDRLSFHEDFNLGIEKEVEQYAPETQLVGKGKFHLDFMLYDLIGIELETKNKGTLEAMKLVPKIILPFLVFVMISMVTRQNDGRVLDKYYVKMKTPVKPDPEADAKELELSYANPERFDDKKLFRHSKLEFVKPTLVDVVGFVLTFVACFVIIGLIVWMTRIGA